MPGDKDDGEYREGFIDSVNKYMQSAEIYRYVPDCIKQAREKNVIDEIKKTMGEYLNPEVNMAA